MDDNTKQPSDETNAPVTQAEEPEATKTEETTVEETAKPSKPEAVVETEASETQSETSKPEQPETNQDEAAVEKSVKEPESAPSEEKVTDEPTQPVTTDEPALSDDKKEDNPNAKWYVVHTYSGHENKVSHTLKQRVESEHLEDKILDILVPMQEKIEIKGGKKVNIKEKIFPGYILVKMVLDDVSWLAVRTTQGVTSFVGMSNKPTPISDAEVATIVKFTQTEAPMYKQVFAVSDAVKIIDGPFADFIGKIDSVDEERGKVKVLVSIFGRETPVELDFLQVQKL